MTVSIQVSTVFLLMQTYLYQTFALRLAFVEEQIIIPVLLPQLKRPLGCGNALASALKKEQHADTRCKLSKCAH